MKENEIKCDCGEESTGWTTIACCNSCGLPIPTEPWYVNKEMLVNRLEPLVIQKIMDIIDKTIELHPYKQVGNADSYCQYNEGWEDGLDRLKSEIENDFTV